RRSGARRALGVVLCIPLLVAAGRDAARIATLEVSDYQRLGQVLAAADPGATVVLRGPSTVAAHYAPEARWLRDLPEDGAVAAVVLDPPAMLLAPDPALEAAVEDLGYVETTFGRLRAYLDPEVAAAAGIRGG